MSSATPLITVLRNLKEGAWRKQHLASCLLGTPQHVDIKQKVPAIDFRALIPTGPYKMSCDSDKVSGGFLIGRH